MSSPRQTLVGTMKNKLKGKSMSWKRLTWSWGRDWANL